MDSKQLNLINQVLTANNNILTYLDKEQSFSYKQMNYILYAELIILYFQINKEYLYNPSNMIIYDIIDSNDYTIEDEYLTYDKYKISFTEAINIIKLNEAEYDYYDNNISKIKVYNPSKIKELTPIEVYYILKKEHQQHLIKDEIVLFSERLYLNRVKKKTKLLLGSLIHKLLINDDLTNIELIDIQFLFCITNINIVFNYLKDKMDFPYEELKINTANTCINKMIYEDDTINEIDNQYNSLTYYTEQLTSQLSFYQQYIREGEFIKNKLKAKLSIVSRQQFELGIELMELKNNPKVFNKYFFNYLLASINNGTFEYNITTNDPLISFYDLESSQLKCFFDIHLSTLIETVNNGIIQEQLDNKHILQKKSN